MADGKNPQDDHIEDLLSQLQGIFGKLSRQEEEESKDKLDAPETPTPPKRPTPAPRPNLAPEEMPLAGPFELKPPPTYQEAPTPAPAPAPVVETFTPPPAAPPPEPVVSAPPPTPVAPSVEPPPSIPEESKAVPVPSAPAVLDPSQLATMVAYPNGRETEARSLASKLETITPKFTKVAFRLKVVWSWGYDSKSDWKDALMDQALQHHVKTIFVVLDRPLDDLRRKALMAEMEKKGIYFQEVPLISIEKKAFYTDVLLGLVFFMDSQKPGQPEQAA